MAPELEKKPKRRVIKNRVVTDQEYYDTLIEKDQKDKEKEEAKKQKAIERQMRKEDKEKKRKAREQVKTRQKKAKENAKKSNSKGRHKRKRSPSLSQSDRNDETFEIIPVNDDVSRFRRVCRPARYQTESDVSDGEESDTVCERCNQREPDGLNADQVMWIDCDACSKWFHVFCVYGRSRTRRRLICEDCLP